MKLTAILCGLVAFAAPAAEFAWRKLDPIPDPIGFAGSFAGVNGGALIVAGGANFPHKMPWEGGVKAWHDEVFVLDKPEGRWLRVGRLPVALGYGVSVSHSRGLVCIGGSNADGHHGSVLVLRWVNGRLLTEPLPGLPQACANSSGALAGDVVYVTGGIERPDSTNALNSLWSMNLGQRRPGWRQLEALPGPGRMLATAGALDGSFYVFGGAALHAGPDGKPVRDWLREAWRYTPGKGWKRIADLPRVSVAAPSPAPALNGKLLVLGGDDGTQANTPPLEHRGFRHDILAYDPKSDRWENRGEAPFALVTTPAVRWEGRMTIPGGEARPGIRSTEIWLQEAR